MRRLGCMFVLLNFLILGVVSLAVGLVAHLSGALQLPGTFRWVVPLGAALALVILGLLFWAGRRLRGMSAPFQSLFDASQRVAAGDFSARAEERGFPEVRSLARAFNEMAARLQITDDQRRALLADVTHELRTPLTVIQGNLEGMLDGVYARDDAQLRLILEETQLLARLVEDLRTLALAESGALELHREAVDLGLLVETTVAALAGTAEAAGVKMRIANISTPTTPIEIDPERIKQVLVNLINNAIRYAGEQYRGEAGGEVTVRCGSDWFEVRDNGAGISAEDLPHIFERFWKGRGSSGMGLGLSIARKLVEAHGGTIRAESNPEGGTLLRVEGLGQYTIDD